MINRFIASAVTVASLGGAAMSSWAEVGSEPLYVKNLSPVAGLLGLPSQRSASAQSSGKFFLAVHSSVASHYVADARGAEQVNLDGETLRFAFEMRYGLAENWDIQLDLPWLQHSGGHLDSAIDNWHDLWGMSDGGRSLVERDLLDMRYASPGTDFSLTDDVSGVGDITLAINHSFYHDENATASVALGYKFATGDEDDLLGSGGDDVYVALRFSGAHLADLPLTWHGQVGYLHAGSSDILGSRLEDNLWFAGLSLDWSLSQNFSLFAQLDMHGAPMSSDISALGDDAYLGTLGARWSMRKNWSLDFSFVEDLQVGAAPDITFQASLRYLGNH